MWICLLFILLVSACGSSEGGKRTGTINYEGESTNWKARLTVQSSNKVTKQAFTLDYIGANEGAISTVTYEYKGEHFRVNATEAYGGKQITNGSSGSASISADEIIDLSVNWSNKESERIQLKAK